jgi:F-type H+-transporting ATPase subunit a
VSGAATVLADGGVPGWPPSVHDFYLPSVVGGAGPWLTKFTLLVWLAVVLILLFFLIAYRDPKLVPTRMQWLAEEIYGFARNDIAADVIGRRDGLRFAPYLATLFVFILVTNIFSIVPFIQISPNAHIAYPAIMAAVSYILFLYVGIRKHGFIGYFKAALIIPGVPWPMLFLVSPIEFFSTFILRPFTLALRLFANMFAGHVILLVFTLGGFVLLNVQSLFIKPISLVSWAMAIALTFFELVVCALQAYVFALLSASYVQGALAEEH